MFNVIVRNHDDHVKNIAFLMNRRGKWRLSPAFDISYAWDSRGEWRNRHQMSINGKRDEFKREDLLALANVAGIKKEFLQVRWIIPKIGFGVATRKSKASVAATG